MRLILRITAGLTLLCSCNNADNTKQSATNDAIATIGGSQFVDNRKNLVAALNKIGATLASNKAEKIADIFSFPLADTSVAIWSDNENFNREYEKNLNKTTREMFIRYYPDVSAAIEIPQIRELFRVIDLNQLLQTDSLEHKEIVKTEPCYSFYEVRIEKDQVTLVAGSASNENYKGKSVGEDEVPANSSEMCEHVIFWVFTYQGGKLVLKNIAAAG